MTKTKIYLTKNEFVVIRQLLESEYDRDTSGHPQEVINHLLDSKFKEFKSLREQYIQNNKSKQCLKEKHQSLSTQTK